MLRFTTDRARPGLVASPCMTSGQETERVNSYNPGACTGLLRDMSVIEYHVSRDEITFDVYNIGKYITVI